MTIGLLVVVLIGFAWVLAVLWHACLNQEERIIGLSADIKDIRHRLASTLPELEHSVTVHGKWIRQLCGVKHEAD